MENYIQIIGFEGLYEISNQGQVISLYFGKRKILKPGIMNSGYYFIPLRKAKKAKNFSVHRLVALHFISNSDYTLEVNHKDGNKLNNHASNLEWVTRSQNVQHSYDNGLKTYRPLHYKGKFGEDHNKSKVVRCVETGVAYGSMSEAERVLNLGGGSVSWSCKHKKPIFGMHFEAGIEFLKGTC